MAVIKIYLILFLLFIFEFFCFCQEIRLSEVITTIAEELAEDDNDPGAIEIYLERLSELTDSPVNLNSGDESELSRLFFLTDFQVKALADYIRSFGRIYSVYEIASVPGFNRETANMVIPFITLEQKSLNREHDSISYFRNTVLTNVTFSSADTSPLPARFLTKYKFTSGSLSGGFTVEKDPGEQLFTGSPPLPDFFSAHLSYTGRGFIRKIIVGDYSMKLGEGTCINTGWQTGLFLTSPGFMSSKDEIKPYTSADENSFFRGAAASFVRKNLSWTIFYSQNKTDASLNDSGDKVRSLYTSGLHNTPLSLVKKDALTDMSFGLDLDYNLKSMRIGIAWTEDRLSLPFEVNPGDPESVYDFSGKRNSLLSLHYKAIVNRFLLFGEATFNKGLDHALVQGLSVRLSDRLTINALLRNYEKGFFSFHGKGPGGNTVNETGITGNFTFEAARHLFVSAGCDLRNYSWLRYRNSSPSRAVKQEVRLKYLPARNLTVEALYNYRFSMNDAPGENGIPVPEELRSDYGRASFRYSPLENLTLTTRIDYKSVRPSGDKGMLLAQDASCSFKKIPLSLWFRYCLFSTDSWDARLYAYENDLLYSFSIPALSGRGSRSYLMVKYEIKEFAEVRVRYGVTSTDEAGKEDLRVQVRMFF